MGFAQSVADSVAQAEGARDAEIGAVMGNDVAVLDAVAARDAAELAVEAANEAVTFNENLLTQAQLEETAAGMIAFQAFVAHNPCNADPSPPACDASEAALADALSELTNATALHALGE